MLSALLTQTATVLSRLFIFSSFVPTLVFAFLNGALLNAWGPGFRAWVSPQLQGTGIAFYTISALVGVAVVAYVLFTLNNFLRVMLETAAFLPAAFRKSMSMLEQERLDDLVRQYIHARNERMAFQRLRDRDKRLKDGVDAGAKATTNGYKPNTDKPAEALRDLEQLSRRSQEIPSKDASLAIDEFKEALSKNNKSILESGFAPPDGDQSNLDQHHRRLLVVLDYGVDRWKFAESEAYNKRQFEFGVLAPRPTRMGNVGESLNGYAVSRYNLNLSLLWSRFFNALRQNKDAFTSVDDAKSQLDFLVACTWLSALTALAWSALLIASGYSVGAFLFMITVGPLITYTFYRFAVQSYLVFVDCVRAAVDQYRFLILESLNVAVPDGLREERQIWDAVDKVVGGRGDYLELSYHPKPKTP